MESSFYEFSELKKSFFKKHDFDYRIDTSQMDEYGQYHKTYSFEDGATWNENYRPVYETVNVAVKGLVCNVNIKLFETEFWNSENSISKFFYEKF